MAREKQAPAKARLKNVLSVKGQPTTVELVNRLKALHEELGALNQDEVDLDSLTSTNAELVSPKLLTHKDKSVKAYTACCLADVLKLTAPDAPYTERELSDIFSFFTHELRNLAKSGDAQMQQYHYLIRNLADVRSICLVPHLPDADKLTNRVFEHLFDSLTPQTPKTIETCIVEVLVSLVDEMDSIPSDVTERILAQFIPKNARARPYTLRVAKAICDESSDKLQRYVSQYFTEVLGQAVDDLKMGDDHDGSDEDDGAHDLDRIKSAHALIREINNSSPGLLLNVIPQLEAELRVDNEALRVMTTKTVGTMLSGNIDLAQKYPALWDTWLGRTTDISVAVRVECVEALTKIWSMHPVHSDAVQRALDAKLADPEEKVRLAVCKVFVQLDFETALHHLDVELLRRFSERYQDRKTSVAIEAVKALARLYSLAYPSIERLEEAAVDNFSWIADALFKALAVPEQDLHAAVVAVIFQHVLPMPSSAEEEEATLDRVILIYSLLDTSQRKTLFRLTNVEKRQNSAVAFLDACENYNGGMVEKDEEKALSQLKAVARSVASAFPSPSKSADDLVKFAKLNDKRLYKLLRALINPSSDLKVIIKAHNELLRKLHDAASSLADTMTIFMRRCALLVLCQSMIPHLLRRVESPAAGGNSENARSVAAELLAFIGEGRPVMFAHHIEMLVDGLDQDKSPAYADVCLSALRALAKGDASFMQGNDALRERCLRYLKVGNISEAKAAGTILALTDTADGENVELVSQLADDLVGGEEERLVANLSALSQFAKHAPAAFEPHGESVTGFVLEELVTKTDPNEMEVDDGADWCDEDKLSTHAKACIAGLKLLINRLMVYDNKEEAAIVSTPVFSLLWSLLDSGGDVKGVQRSLPVASHLRSHASTSLLRLATNKFYEEEVLKGFTLLAWTIQDPVFQVRHTFLSKVTQYLHRQRLTLPIYNMVLFLVAHDPEQDNKDMAKASVVNRVRLYPQEMRVNQFERILLRLLHLLAHHPDFSNDPEEVAVTARYISFYLDCVATSTNISFLFHLAQCLKTVRDAHTQTHTDNLYIISDMTAYLVRRLAKEKKWTLSQYNGVVTLPETLYKALPSNEVRREIFKRSYLEKEAQDAIEQDLKEDKPKKQRARKDKPVKEKATKAKAAANDEEAAKAEAKPQTKKRKSDADAPKPKAKRVAKKPAKRRKSEEWDSNAEESEAELDLGGTSEDEVKPKGSRTRPKPKTPKKKPVSSGDAENEEVDSLLTTPQKAKSKKTSPKRRQAKKKKQQEQSEEDEAVDMSA